MAENEENKQLDVILETSVSTDDNPDKNLEATIETLNGNIAILNETIKELRCDIKEYKADIKQLKKDLKAKDELINGLLAQINKNSRNSSKPSSTDGYRKPSPKPSAVNKGSRTKKSNGGQPGHEGTTMKLSSEPDEKINLLPSECMVCPFAGTCSALLEAGTVQTRDQIHLQISVIHNQYCQKEVVCPMSDMRLRGVFPDDVTAPYTYSSSVKALVSALSTFGMVSFNRIKEFMSGLGVRMSEGTIANILKTVGELSRKQRERLKGYLLGQPVIHVDETGMKEKGKGKWVHTVATEHATFLAAVAKRGKKGMDEIGFLPDYHGIAVHDRMLGYFDEGFDFEDAICNAHIDRDLQGIIENYNQKWARSMQILLKDMLKAVRVAKAKGLDRLSDSQLKKFSDRYDDIVDKGLHRNPFVMEVIPGKRGKKKQHPARNLAVSLQKLKDGILRFIHDFRVPFSNNIAERSFRLAKVKNKVAGSFRKDGGIDDFVATYSIIDTCRKNGLNAFSTLIDMIEGHDVLSFLNA